MPSLSLSSWGDKLHDAAGFGIVTRPARGLIVAGLFCVATAVVLPLRGFTLGADLWLHCHLWTSTIVAVVAVAVGLAIYLRNWRPAIGLIASTLVSVAIALLALSLTGWALTGGTLAALVAVVVLAIYDSVVVFDRIREQVADFDAQRDNRASYGERVNLALTRTLPRSVGVAALPVLLTAPAIFLTSGTLRSAALVLSVGAIAVGAATVFVAVPLAVLLRGNGPSR